MNDIAMTDKVVDSTVFLILFFLLPAVALANAVNNEPYVISTIFNAVFFSFLALTFGLFFLFRRYSSLTWIGLFSLPVIVGISFAISFFMELLLSNHYEYRYTPLQIFVNLVLSYFLARFLISFFIANRVVHGGRIQDITWFLIVTLLYTSILLWPGMDIILSSGFMATRTFDFALVLEILNGGSLIYLPIFTICWLPFLLMHDMLVGRSKRRPDFLPARLTSYWLFKPVFIKFDMKTPSGSSNQH